MTNKELAPARVFACVRHGERPGDMLWVVLLRVHIYRVARTARPDRPLAGLGVGSPPWTMKFGITRWNLGSRQ